MPSPPRLIFAAQVAKAGSKTWRNEADIAEALAIVRTIFEYIAPVWRKGLAEDPLNAVNPDEVV